MKSRNRSESQYRGVASSAKKVDIKSAKQHIKVYDAGGGEGRSNLRYDTLRDEQMNMYRRSLEPGALTQYMREQELRQTKLVEEIVTLTVNVAREDYPSIANDITIKYPVSAAQSAWGRFLEDIRVSLGLEFIDCIVDCVDRSPVYRILRLRPSGRYYVRQREDSAVLECINTGKVPVQVSWASTMIINSSKAELVYAGDYHTRMEERVDELILRPLTKAEEFNASRKILAAASAAEIIEIIDEIMKIQKDAVDDGEQPPDLDVISLHRLALESISRLAQQGSAEQRNKVTSESVDFILDTIESFRSEVDVVTLALQVINEFNLSHNIDTADVYHLLLDCIQYFAPEAPEYRPKRIPKRLRPPDEDPMLTNMLTAKGGGGERGGGVGGATHRSEHNTNNNTTTTTARGVVGGTTLTGRSEQSGRPSGTMTSTESSTFDISATTTGELPLIAEKPSQESEEEGGEGEGGNSNSTSDTAVVGVGVDTAALSTLTMTMTMTAAAVDGELQEPPIPKLSYDTDTDTDDARDRQTHTLPPLPLGGGSARGTSNKYRNPGDKSISRREARRIAMEEEEQEQERERERERERIRLESEAATLAEEQQQQQRGGTAGSSSAAAQRTLPPIGASAVINTNAGTSTGGVGESTTRSHNDPTNNNTSNNNSNNMATARTNSRQGRGRSTVRAVTPDATKTTGGGKHDDMNKTAAAAAKTNKGWKGTKGSTDTFKLSQTTNTAAATSVDAAVDEKEQKKQREKEERKKRREAQQQLRLLSLPDVPSTKFQGFAGKLRKSMPLLQSFASLFKVISFSYENRELAFEMGIDEEVAEVALLCGSQPRVLDYCMFIMNGMLSDAFGVGNLMTVYMAEMELDSKTEIRRVTWDFLERSVGFLGGSKMDLENLINPPQMTAATTTTTTTTSRTKKGSGALPTITNSSTIAAAVTVTASASASSTVSVTSNNLISSSASTAASTSSAVSVVSVIEKPKRAYSLQRSSGKYMFINKPLMNSIGVKLFKDRYLALPQESVVLAVAMITATVDMDPKERTVAMRWLDLWDDDSMGFRVLKKRGKDISGLCFNEYS